MKTSYTPTFLLSVLMIGLISCIEINNNNDDNGSKKIVGKGELVEKTITLESFSKINLLGQGNITIVKGETQVVKIKAQQNILDVLTNKITGGELRLSPKEGVNLDANKGIFYEIQTPTDISGLVIAGAGNIDISGDGQEQLNITIMGTGNVDAYKLEVSHCLVNVSGVGNCNVNVVDKLDVTIAGVGTINYKGKPDIAQNIMGIGKVINDN